MTLVCRPRGRGNWRVVEIQISKPPDLFAVRVGELIRIGPWLFRVVRVEA